MVVNQNLSKGKVFLTGLFCACFLLFICSFGIGELRSTKNYIKTNGTIDDIKKEIHYSNRKNKKAKVVKYICYSYKIGDSVYSGKMRTLLPFLYKKGDKYTIYYNPENPETVRNTFLIKASFAGAILVFAFLIIVVVIFNNKMINNDDIRSNNIWIK